jgi:hypothetical protein
VRAESAKQIESNKQKHANRNCHAARLYRVTFTGSKYQHERCREARMELSQDTDNKLDLQRDRSPIESWGFVLFYTQRTRSEVMQRGNHFRSTALT